MTPSSNNSFIEASKQLHKDNQNYGSKSEYSNPESMKFKLSIPTAIKAAQQICKIKSILDHGTGQGGLIKTLNEHNELQLDVQGYDPCIPKFSNKPFSKFDIVTSIDVLEHVGKEYISTTLGEIREVTGKFFFFCIDLLPASKLISDGRNAHFTIAPSEWWIQEIKRQFKIVSSAEFGKMHDGSDYPMHLLGCASNSMDHFKSMNRFLENIDAFKYQWVLTEKSTIRLKPWKKY